MAEENEENKDKEKEKENIPPDEPKKDPIPLSSEGESSQLELETKPKTQDKPTTVRYQKPGLIKSIISAQKEGPSDGVASGGASNPTQPPKEDIKSVQDRLAKEQEQYEGEKPSEEECKDTADMFVFIIDMILSFIASRFALDKDDKEYQMDKDRKKTLTKYLAIYLAKMNKKYPIGFMLCITAVVCCLPVFSKAYSHRKMVEEERAKNKKSTVVASDPNGVKKRRRRSDDDNNNGGGGRKSDDDLPLTPVEVLN